MSKELNKYYKRVTTYICSVEDMSSNDWEYIKHYAIGENSMAAVRTAYPLLTEKQCVNKNASLNQNRVVQEQLTLFRNKLEANRKQALTDIYHTISELELDRAYMLRRAKTIMNDAEQSGDFPSALKAWDLISKVQGHYSPIVTKNEVDINITYGGQSVDSLLNANNNRVIDIDSVDEEPDVEEM